MKRNFYQWVNYIMGDEIKTMTWHYGKTQEEIDEMILKNEI